MATTRPHALSDSLSREDPGLLLRWLRWYECVIVGFGVVFLALFAATHSLASGIIGGSLLALVWPSLGYVRWLARRGRIRAALVWVTISLWLLALLIASRGAVAVSTAVPLLFLPTIVSVFYLPARAHTWFALGSFAVAGMAASLSVFGPSLPSSLSRDQLELVVMLGTTLTFGTALIAIWNVGSLLRDALATSQQRNVALVESERLLEEKVATRTVEIEQKAGELESALAEIADVDAIGRAASASLDLDHVLDRVMHALQKLFDFDQLGVSLFDVDRGQLVLSRMLGAGFTPELRDKLAGTAIPSDERGSAFLYVARAGEPLFVPEMRDELARSPTDRLYFEANPPRSLLILPLEVDAEVVGVLYFGNTRRHIQLESQEIERVRRYVTPIAIAIHNARLFEDTQAARAEALEASRTKSRFLANMSHELRTPLNAVIGYSEMLQEEARERQVPEFVDDLERIRSAGRHLLELINEILDLSKVEAGRMELLLESFDVEALVQGVVSTVKPMAEANQNALAFEKAGADLGRMHSDPTKVRQILLNLLANACKFTREGRVGIRAERAGTSPERISLQVSDTGIGMTPDQCSRVFDAFAQATTSTTREYGGTGLGLTITRQFCELLGGSIEVESEPGVGTRFIVDLPVECGEGG